MFIPSLGHTSPYLAGCRRLPGTLRYWEVAGEASCKLPIPDSFQSAASGFFSYSPFHFPSLDYQASIILSHDPAHNLLVLLGIKQDHLCPGSRDRAIEQEPPERRLSLSGQLPLSPLPAPLLSFYPPHAPVSDGWAQWMRDEHLGFLRVS